MKKWVLLLLCLAMLLLPACQKATITPPTGSDGDYYEWNRFVWDCKEEGESSFVMLRAKESGGQERVTINYNGETYTITDDAGSRSYTYLICDTHVEKTDKGYAYGDYFFLTNDPNMTFDRYQKAQSSSLKDHMQLLLPTELVLGKTGLAEDAVCFGDAPKEIETVLSRQLGCSAEYYGENSFFTKTLVVLAGSGRMISRLTRYDYNGTQISSVELPLPIVSCVIELDNGGFLAALKDNDKVNCLVCYDADGKLLWQTDFRGGQDVYLRYLFKKGDTLYCFGKLNADSATLADDLYFAKFTMDGTLVKEKISGGDDFESLNHVTVSDKGFTVYGQTQSSNGDFPFSEDGFAAGFKVQVSDELELSGAEAYQKNEDVSRHYGFHNGAPIYDADPIMNPVAADQLPDDLYNEAIFAFGDGYVILRWHRLERYLFAPPEMSAQFYYVQLIATYYDASGTPVWQTVSEPFWHQ